MPDPSVPELGWAFLVARGRRRGYRAILVPEFLAETNEYGVLVDAVGGDSSGSGAPRVGTVAIPGAGPIACAYRTQRLTHGELDENGILGAVTGREPHDLALDEHGRPLEMLYGFVCRTGEIRDANEADLVAAHAEALGAYRRFLANESRFALETSRPFALRSVTSPPLETTSASPPARGTEESVPPPPTSAAAANQRSRDRSRAVPVVAVALLLMIVSATVWAVLLGPKEGRVTEVNVDKPRNATVDCGVPVAVVFRATVTTNGAANVAYHWEGTVENSDSTQRQLSFDAAGSKQVATRLPVRLLAGNRIAGAMSLVVESPNRKRDSVTYTLTCKGQNRG